MVSSLAQQTIKRVSDGLENGEAGGLAEIVELIQQLSSQAFDTPIQELAALIGKDVVVTAKVITAANSMGYNPSGLKVSTISQAIQVIGFNKIRQLAISLLMVENAERTLNPSEKREIAALALCSGIMAESVMGKRDTHSAEQAFICASLRNYGRLLMTTFMIDEYRRARIMATEGQAEDDAFNHVFGLTPLELGYHLLSCAHLPDAILKSLQALPPDAIRKVATQPDLELLLLSDLSVRLCELAFRSDLNAADFEQRVNSLAARAGTVFDLDFDGMLGLLQEVGQQLSTFANLFGLNALAQDYTPRLRARVSRSEPAASPIFRTKQPTVAPPSPPSRPPSAPPVARSAVTAAREGVAVSSSVESGPSPGPRGEAAPPSPSSESVFQRAFDSGIEQLADLLDQQPVDMRKIYRVVMKAAVQGFGAQEGAIFVREKPNRPYVAFHGEGKFFSQIQTKSLLNETDRDVFGLSLQRLEDVFISDTSDAKISVHLPAWSKTPSLASFMLLPIHENRRPFALLLAGWNNKKAVGFDVAQLRQVRSLLRLVGTARRLAEV